MVFPFEQDYNLTMKRRDKSPIIGGCIDIKLYTLSFRSLAAALVGVGGLLATSALAVNEDNPYEGIVSRNAFGLKPPAPPPVAAPPVAPPAGIDLQGITTILGRPQVLLRIKMPPASGQAAKDKSVVLDVGQREGEVEVVSIDALAGVVKLRNRGEDLALNMKDNAVKPEVGPAAPVAGMGSPGAIPAPSGAIPAPAQGGGTTITTFGGSGSALPSRSLRGSPTAPGLPSSAANPQAQQRELSAEEGTILLEVNRKINEGKGLPFPPPRVKLD